MCIVDEPRNNVEQCTVVHAEIDDVFVSLISQS